VKEAIFSDKAPKPAGPYSQAIAVDRQVFFSGQIAMDPETGDIVSGDAGAHAERVLQNLGLVLQAAGLTYGDVCKATVFLVNMDDFDMVNAVYAKYFDRDRPARTTVAVLALPRGSLVEIDAFAVKSS